MGPVDEGSRSKIQVFPAIWRLKRSCDSQSDSALDQRQTVLAITGCDIAKSAIQRFVLENS
jgi:hypothetical protein